MQIDVDFDVFKALTALRANEADSYNAVIRRLLALPTRNALLGMNDQELPRALLSGVNALAGHGPEPHQNALSALAHYAGGAWFGNVRFPDGTKFRATYKGQTYLAEIKEGKWVGADGAPRSSPSHAASAITKTNVNGWRFWFAQMPDDPSWRRMDEFKK